MNFFGLEIHGLQMNENSTTFNLSTKEFQNKTLIDGFCLLSLEK